MSECYAEVERVAMGKVSVPAIRSRSGALLINAGYGSFAGQWAATHFDTGYAVGIFPTMWQATKFVESVDDLDWTDLKSIEGQAIASVAAWGGHRGCPPGPKSIR